jgi:hypothetical protein
VLRAGCGHAGEGAGVMGSITIGMMVQSTIKSRVENRSIC